MVNEREIQVENHPSRVCRRCGRKLEDPGSVKIGIGPVCRNKPIKAKTPNLDDFVKKLE